MLRLFLFLSYLCLYSIILSNLVEFQFWQTIHDVNCLDADIDDTQQEVEDVAGLVMFAGPVVGIVLDERLLVLGDGVTLHNPFNGRFSVDDILVGFLRDVLDGDVAVVDDGALIVLDLRSSLLTLGRVQVSLALLSLTRSLGLEAHLIYHTEVIVGSIICWCLDIAASRWVTLHGQRHLAVAMYYHVCKFSSNLR